MCIRAQSGGAYEGNKVISRSERAVQEVMEKAAGTRRREGGGDEIMEMSLETIKTVGQKAPEGSRNTVKMNRTGGGSERRMRETERCFVTESLGFFLT